MTEDEKNIERRIMPWRFWFFVVLSLLLGITFIWVLPDLFINHTSFNHPVAQSTQGTQNMPGMNMNMPGMSMPPGMMMPDGTMMMMGPTMNHEEKDITQGTDVSLTVRPPQPETGSTTQLSFFVNNKPEGTPITNLMLMHDKYMHVIGVRDDMEGFFHIHPEPVTDKTYSKSIEAPPNGWKIAEKKFDGVGVYLIYPPTWETEKNAPSSAIKLLTSDSDVSVDGTVHSGYAQFVAAAVAEGIKNWPLDEIISEGEGVWFQNVESRKQVTIGGQKAIQLKGPFQGPTGQKFRVIKILVPYRSSVYEFTFNYLQDDPKESQLVKDFISLMDSVVFVELEVIQPGLWTVEHTFDKPGTYKIWSEVTTSDGTSHVFGQKPFTVAGAGPTSAKKVSFDKTAVVDKYQVTLDYGALAKGQAAGLGFSIKDSAGKEVQVEPYLAADMHLAVIKDDWTQFMHTHPNGPQTIQPSAMNLHLIPEAYADGVHATTPLSYTPKGSLQFAVTFPTSGVYKVFAQFRPKGTDLPKDEALAASFWVKVDESVPFTLGSNRALNTVISLILIVLLSLAVKKFLEPRTYPTPKP